MVRVEAVLGPLIIASLALIAIGSFIAVGAFTREPYVVLERTLYRVERASLFNLTFLLHPNEIYEAEALTPAPNSTPIYISLVREMVVNYTYTVSQGTARGRVAISVILAHPDGWSKKYLEVPVEISSGRASTTLSLNLTGLVELMARLSKQVMARSDTFTMRLVASIDTTIYLQQYSIRDQWVHTLELPVLVGYNRVEFSGGHISARTFEEKSRTSTPATIMGTTVENARSISIAISTAGVSLLASAALARLAIKRPSKPGEILERRYGQLIVEVGNSTATLKGHRNVIYIEKPEELVKLSRALEKPILKECVGGDTCEYYIVDQDVKYTLRSDSAPRGGAEGERSQGEGAGPGGSH